MQRLKEQFVYLCLSENSTCWRFRFIFNQKPNAVKSMPYTWERKSGTAEDTASGRFVCTDAASGDFVCTNPQKNCSLSWKNFSVFLSLAYSSLYICSTYLHHLRMRPQDTLSSQTAKKIAASAEKLFYSIFISGIQYPLYLLNIFP
jgi:hypothetical protein